MVLGFGYYRVTLFIFSYFIFKAILRNEQARRFLNFFYVPIIGFSLYFDYMYGSLWSMYKWERFYHSILLIIIIDYTATKYINAFVELVSDGRVFSYCTKCKYENIKLTSVCKNCGYDAERGNGSSHPSDNTNTNQISYSTNYPLLSQKLTDYEIANIGLSTDEIIRVCLKRYSLNAIYIDGIKTLCTYIVITNRHLIIIDSIKVHRGWRFREKVKLDSIIDVSAEKRKFGPSGFNVVKVTTNNHVYEFTFWMVDKSREEHIKYTNVVRNLMLHPEPLN